MKRFYNCLVCAAFAAAVTLSSSSAALQVTPPSKQSLKQPVSAVPGTPAVPAAQPSGVMPVISRAEQDGYEKLTVRSKILGKEMKIDVHLPQNYNAKKRYAVLYLFHGFGGKADDWMDDLGAGKTSDSLAAVHAIRPLIIVSPEIDNSFGINSSPFTLHLEKDGRSIDMGAYEDYIVRELLPFVDATYSTVTSRDGRYIGGLSMGGYIALHTAFLHNDLFSRAGGHSPALWTDEALPAYVHDLLYPTEELRNQRDPIRIAESRDLKGLQVYLDCGDRDALGFYNGCARLTRVLRKQGVAVRYTRNFGGHEGAYWRTHVREYLLFYGGW